MELQLTRKQGEVFQRLQTRAYKYILFSGGVGSGKSVLLSYICLAYALKYPGTRYAVFRKNLTTLKRTTLQTFQKSVENLGISFDYNRSDYTWTFENGSTIFFIELDHTKDADFNKIKSLELTCAFVDEVNELAEGAFNTLMTRVGRCNTNGEPMFIFMTCNPAQNWVKTRFYDKWQAGTLQKPYLFEQALPKDNPFLPKEYLESLEHLPPAEYARYVQGDWEQEEDEYQLISYELIKKNLVNQLKPSLGDQKLGIDIARSGADSSVICRIDDHQLLETSSWQGNDTNWTSHHIKSYIDTHQILHNNVNIDVIGVGAGVVDNLVAWRYAVNDFNSAGSPSKRRDDHFYFGNARAESYWDLKQRFVDGSMNFIHDPVLIRHLLAIRYEIRGKNIFIEDKEKIKKRLGESPDRADALAMAVYQKQGMSFAML